jgi:hypothetical protein
MAVGWRWASGGRGGRGQGHGGTHQVDALDNYPHFLSEDPDDLAFLALVLPSDHMHLTFSLVRILVRYERPPPHYRNPPPSIHADPPSPSTPGRVVPREH